MKKLSKKDRETPVPVDTVQTRPEKRRVPLTHRTAAKAAAFVMAVVIAALAAGSVFATAAMLGAEVYTTPLKSLRYENLRGLAENDAQQILNYLSVDDDAAERDAMQYLSGRNIANVSVTFTPAASPLRVIGEEQFLQPADEKEPIVIYRFDGYSPTDIDTYNLPNIPVEPDGGEAPHIFTEKGTLISVPPRFADGESWTYSGGRTAASTPYCSRWYCHTTGDGYFYYSPYFDGEDPTNQGETLVGTAEVMILLADTFTEQDAYFFVDTLIRVAYAMRYWVFAIAAAALITAIACFVFLLCASGRRAGFDAPQPGWGTRVPFDLLTGTVLFAAFILLQFTVEAPYFHSAFKRLALYAVVGLALFVIALGWCMSAAVRLKLGDWWKNTLVYHALRIAAHFLRKLWAILRGTLHGIVSLGRSVPLVWKSVAAFAAIAAVELLVTACSWCEPDVLLVFWFCKSAVLFALVLMTALMLRRLQRGGEALAAGDLAYQVETNRLLWDFKRHGENLNRIGEGMSAAVEQRLKSERMKTELITNVSHDIKTPLTSIINYADLIEKEPCENGKVTGYAAVLHRQSERLKRLIDDLVEASKASTGNLEVQLAPCEIGVLLTQAAGEYEQRLRERELELVAKTGERPLKIRADGRRLWRVFDNLMGNACKYAQSGTRVYLTLEENEGQAVISLKNTSREMLDIPSEELLERFVRGDASRKTEGSGLGLSIAKSLTELQGGSMELVTDGDLFKVVLRFPVIS